MNDLDLCLEVVSRSRQPLRYIWRRISRKPIEIEVWFQRTTNREWHTGYRMVTWPMTSRDPERSNSWPPIRLERNISKTTWARDLIWYAALYRECRAGAQINFPESGRGLVHASRTIFGIRSNISQKLHRELLQTWYAALTAGFCIQWSTVGQYGRLS